ncbi:futalosine hydrolase [Filimonas lacunae]|uniref:Futalosine hydrolase n=3 Tax=Filimonas lacunae TaxID=477680 RepID=A0A1N7PVG1_9BACT|nr:futalosine hydrolase [Filimonas lacunae]
MPAYAGIDPLYTGNSQRMHVTFHQGGVGLLATAFSLTKLIYEEKPDLIIQAGIAGCFDTTQPLAKVLVIKDESLADTGVQEEGRWKDIFDLKLEKPGYPPFEKRRLSNPWLPQYNLLKLPEVSAITINTITTGEKRIQQIRKKYNPVIESMEGAALHYACRQTNTPFIQIRAISNYIGERDKSKWRIKDAIGELNQVLLKYIDKLYKIG